ncbi:MAG TPA: hypothetical protein VK721_09855 [Solirubrobacteraceae bacterium]|jgi:hypothetical protein|nr:hypothetical protein [Solirubrobacteraceae bacterium]
MQTEKDAEIVGWIGRVGAAGAEHVMARFGMGRSWAYARLSCLVRDGLLEQKTLLYRQPGLYVASAEGLRWRGLERLGVYRVGAGGFEHACRLATVAVAIHRGLPGWELWSERELRLAESDRGELVASARVGELPGGRPAVHRPDLAVISPDGRVLAVEVELSVKAPRRLAAICRGYARVRQLERVYYLAAPAAARAVSRAVAETRAEDRITVLSLSDTDTLIVAEREGASHAGV